MQWTTIRPDKPGAYIVCMGDTCKDTDYEIAIVRWCKGQSILEVLVRSFSPHWWPLDVVVGLQLNVLRWCEVSHPPTVDELQAAELETI